MHAIEQLPSSIAAGARHLGDIVFWDLRGRFLRTDVERLVDECGLEDDLQLPRLTTINAYRRAVRESVTGDKTLRAFEVVEVQDDEAWLVHAIVEKKIVAQYGANFVSSAAAEFSTAVRIAFDKVAYNAGAPASDLVKTEDDHPVVRAFLAKYEEMAVVYRHDDIRTAFQRAFHRWRGMRLSANGGIWYIPSVSAERVRAWQRFMMALKQGAHIIQSFDTSDTIAALQASAADSLDNQLATMLEELEGFATSGSVRQSTLEDRVQQFDDLRAKAELYESLLSMNASAIKTKLTEAKTALLAGLAAMDAAKKQRSK